MTTSKTFNVVSSWGKVGMNEATLSTIARLAGFATYQAMIIHMTKRVYAESVNALTPYAPIDTEIRRIVQSVQRTASERIEKPKSSDLKK